MIASKTGMHETDRPQYPYLRGRTVLATLFLLCAVAVAWSAMVGEKDAVLSRVFRAEPTRDPDEPTEGEDNARDIRRHYDFTESIIYPNLISPNFQNSQRLLNIKICELNFFV